MYSFSKFLAGSAVFAASAFFHTGAAASDVEGSFALRGYGSRTCETFNTEFPDSRHAANYGSWLMGYATARNRVESGTFDVLPLPDGAVFLQAVSAICADQPTITVEAAAHEVIRATSPMHQRNATAIVVIEHKGRTIAIREGALKALQSRLSERGMYSGPIDGQWGTAIAAAVETFQKREKITVTGVPDLATLFRALVL